jgi:hypothetical protein
MHPIVQTVDRIVAPFREIASILAGAFSDIAGSPWGMFAIAAAIVASLALAIACGGWAIAERNRAVGRIGRLSRALRQLQSTLHFSNALIHALPESVVVIPTRNHQMLNFQGGSKLLKQCLEGPDAGRLASEMDRLLKRGTGFSIDVRTIGLRDVAVRGHLVGDNAVIFLRGKSAAFGPLSSAIPVDRNTPIKPKPTRALIDVRNPRPLERVHGCGEAIIGVDGRLKRHNPAFAKEFSLAESELRNEPTLQEIAMLHAKRNGRDAIWDIIAAAVASPDPELYGNWSVHADADGRRVSLSFSRLSDGSTRIVFAHQPAHLAEAA